MATPKPPPPPELRPDTSANMIGGVSVHPELTEREKLAAREIALARRTKWELIAEIQQLDAALVVSEQQQKRLEREVRTERGLREDAERERDKAQDRLALSPSTPEENKE